MKLLISLFLLLLLTIGAGLYGKHFVESWSLERHTIPSAIVYDFKRGTSLKQLSLDLYQRGVVNKGRLLHYWVRYFDDYSKFQAGSYKFEGAIAPADIISMMKGGDTFVPVVLQFTIPEGFTYKKITDRLVAGGVGSPEEFAALEKSKTFLTEHKIPSSSVEGYLYPATYPFSKIPTVKQALSRMIDTFWDNLPPDYAERVAEKELTLEQAVTFASLIELETAHDDERNLVSEVIWNRLNDNITLGIDASVIYGVADYKGNLQRKHLDDATNPYNSRIHGGLPPTAIGSPSRKSLEAVLTPSNFGYYYYVLDPSQGNRHHFSKTLKEHNRYVRKLINATRRNKRAASGRQ